MFKSSLTIMKISGIPIRLHISFLVILPFFAFVIGSNINDIAMLANVNPDSLGLNPYWLGFIMAILLFSSVVMHELSHSLVARSRGIEIKNITLMLLGGVAQLEDDSMPPRDEAFMAFAGPLFSLVFGVLLLFVLRPLTGYFNPDYSLAVYYLGYINIFLAFFNLLPAFPSDGGRILRSLIASRTSYLRATQIATAIGKAFAFIFGIIGLLYGQLILVLIAFFIYIGASQEYKMNQLRDAFSDFTVAELMTEDVVTVNENIKVQELLELMIRERHTGYPVVNDQGELTGCVTMEDTDKIEAKDKKLKNISEIMSCDIITVRPDESLFDAFVKMSKSDIGRLMVMDNGELVGILTRSDVMKAYRLKLIQQKSME